MFIFVTDNYCHLVLIFEKYKKKYSTFKVDQIIDVFAGVQFKFKNL